jgi:hypothetical protein
MSITSDGGSMHDDWIFLLVLLMVILYDPLVNFVKEDRAHMRFTFRQWLHSSGRQLLPVITVTTKQKDIVALNTQALGYFLSVYVFNANTFLKRFRLFFALTGWLSMTIFAMSTLMAMASKPIIASGPWGEAVFSVFLTCFCVDIFLAFWETRLRRAQAIPALLNARISWALARNVGDRQAQLVLLGNIKNIFGDTTPKLPSWWLYGLVSSWLPNFLGVTRRNAYYPLIIILPFLFFDIKEAFAHGHGTIIHIASIVATAFLTLCVFVIGWIWPFDVIQDMRPWLGMNSNAPTFQMLVFWRDLTDSTNGWTY